MMRINRAAVVAVASLALIGLTFSGRVIGQDKPKAKKGAAPAAAPAVRIIDQAPKDHAIAIPVAKYQQYFKDMDAKHEETLRMVEGGKFNVNIRRIKTPEAAPLVHPMTIDLWYVLDGSGSVTTGGHFDGKVDVGGVTYPLKPGDVIFIPANLPHWVSQVGPGGITWLNTRWDTDWPRFTKMGAGNAHPYYPGAPAARGLAPLEYAQTDHAVYIPKEKLESYMDTMEQVHNGTTRMIEGGFFNVNIRMQQNSEPSTEYHDVTIDQWVVLRGAGTANTGWTAGPDGRGRAPGTGTDTPVKVGDLMFIPSHYNHGFGAVDGEVSWLNIRWDDDYGTPSK
jgi:mannose-6-phosphate isomerase-like protein (cupin superfamily)